MPRFYCPTPLITGALLDLPAGAARHVQVLRLQPGDRITLFNGGPDVESPGGEFDATVTRMGRSDVQALIGAHYPTEREAPMPVHLAVGMPANDRMDWLVEKATELGTASIQPLMTERSVLRLAGDRAHKKVQHWQSVAIAACEQCGGNRVPRVHGIASFSAWIRARAQAGSTLSLLLSLHTNSIPLCKAVVSQQQVHAGAGAITFLSGPEGGLSPAEENTAIDHGFSRVNLGPRVLRAETAALAALASLAALTI